jgi:hypothetical protein
MQPSPVPPESPGKAGGKEANPMSMSRFKALARELFATDAETLKVELEKEKAERRSKRGGAPPDSR